MKLNLSVDNITEGNYAFDILPSLVLLCISVSPDEDMYTLIVSLFTWHLSLEWITKTKSKSKVNQQSKK